MASTPAVLDGPSSTPLTAARTQGLGTRANSKTVAWTCDYSPQAGCALPSTPAQMPAGLDRPSSALLQRSPRMLTRGRVLHDACICILSRFN